MNRLTFRSLITALALFVLLCVPSIASADGITWNLIGAFSDGGKASGSFNYNALTNNYSSIAITTTKTLVFPGASYTTLSPVFGSSSTGALIGPNLANLTNTPLLFLIFDAPLTNLGGTVPLIGFIEGTCNNSDCSNNTASRFVIGGEVSSVAVGTPEPSVLSLLGMGLFALLVGAAAIRKVSRA